MREEEQQLRDIFIIYGDIKISAKVGMNKIVSQFFKFELQSFKEQFKRKAKQLNLNFVDLPKEGRYDVTLNSTNTNSSSVLNAGICFGNYDKKKILRFYIHSFQIEGCQEQKGVNNNIVFTLIKGNINQKEYSFDISNMKYEEVESKIREIFQIDPLMPIKYKNLKDNTFINLNDKNTKPINIFKQLRINKIGVYPVYQAG